MMVIQPDDYEIYFDDSGTHAESNIVVAVCYIASNYQWTHFVRNWNEAREEEGFDVFHMADFMQPSHKKIEPYCHWDDQKRTRVYKRLATIIRVRARHGFGIAFNKKDYDDFATDEVKRHYAKDHYAYAAKCLIGLIKQWRVRWNVTKPMAYIFDQMPKGKGGKGEIMAVWESIGDDYATARDHGLVKNGYSFQDKAIFKPLQAADILAWNMYNHHLNVITKGLDDVKHCDWKFRLLRQDRPMSLGWLTRDQIENLFVNVANYQQEKGTFPSAVVQARINRENRKNAKADRIGKMQQP
jgi:hypothetical protein